MTIVLSIIVLGFFLGMRHATDADHVIAVTTIVSRERSMRNAALIGALWGTGHTITIFVVGSIIILFGFVVSPRLGLTMELSVGLMLIVLGILNLSGMLRWITETFTPPDTAFDRARNPDLGSDLHVHTHAHVHNHGDYVHSHPHRHNPENDPENDPENHGHAENRTPVGWMDRNFARLGAYQALRPLAVGVVHGLAGSAAVALLVLTTIRNPFWAIVYLLVFGIGTIAGMMLATAAIALPFTYSQNRFAKLNSTLAFASGLISLGFGLLIVYRMGYVNGIFTNHPRWIPH